MVHGPCSVRHSRTCLEAKLHALGRPRHLSVVVPPQLRVQLSCVLVLPQVVKRNRLLQRRVPARARLDGCQRQGFIECCQRAAAAAAIQQLLACRGKGYHSCACMPAFEASVNSKCWSERCDISCEDAAAAVVVQQLLACRHV